MKNEVTLPSGKGVNFVAMPSAVFVEASDGKPDRLLVTYAQTFPDAGPPFELIELPDIEMFLNCLEKRDAKVNGLRQKFSLKTPAPSVSSVVDKIEFMPEDGSP